LAELFCKRRHRISWWWWWSGV